MYQHKMCYKIQVFFVANCLFLKNNKTNNKLKQKKK